MTVATYSGGRQRTRTDGLPQATCAAALAGRAATWLRDEEAAGSSPATPTGSQVVVIVSGAPVMPLAGVLLVGP